MAGQLWPRQDKHFSVEGTLVKAGALMKSFQPKIDATPSDDEDRSCLGSGGNLKAA
jgi:hypothetical protein